MRRGLAAAVTVALFAAGCLIGIDETKLDRPSDGGSTSDGTPGDAQPTLGLVGAWSFEETSGTAVVDSSGNGNDGVLQGPVLRVIGLRGKGFATTRASISQFFEVASLSGSAFPSTGTLSFWYRATLDGDGQLEEGDLFDVATLGQAKLQIHHLLDAMDEGIEVRFNSQSGTIAEAKVLLARGEWNHVIVAWDSLRGSVYAGPSGAPLDLMTSTFSTAFRPAQEKFQLGIGVVGIIDEARLYNRALDDSEVRRIP